MSVGGAIGAVGRWLHGREYIKLLLHWRWLVLAISIPISLVIELIEGQGEDLHLLDEVLLDGLVLPFTTWIVLTFAARHMAVQFAREAALERRRQFNQRLAEHRELSDLVGFLVRFPGSMLPVEHATLELFDQEEQQLRPMTAWGAAGPGQQDRPDYRLVLIHEGTQVGVLSLTFAAGLPAAPAQRAELSSYAPDIAVALARAVADHRHAEQAFREARAYERRRITQELHDSLAQQVFYLHLGLDQLVDEAAIDRNPTIKGKVSSMRDVAADVYEQIRNNLSILRAWEQVNLTEAVTDLARLNAQSADMAIDINVQGEPGWLSPHTCEHLYGVVREALNNVVKHARATHVQLSLQWSPEDLTIALADNGVGFDTGQSSSDRHYGLAIMREMVESLRGELSIASALGSGTRLSVRVPIQRTEADPWPSQFRAALGSPSNSASPGT